MKIRRFDNKTQDIKPILEKCKCFKIFSDFRWQLGDNTTAKNWDK